MTRIAEHKGESKCDIYTIYLCYVYTIVYIYIFKVVSMFLLYRCDIHGSVRAPRDFACKFFIYIFAFGQQFVPQSNE